MLKFFSRLLLVLVFALAIVAGAGFAAYHFLPTAPTSSDVSGDEDVLEDDTYNVLLCGVDGKHENADTIVLASFNTEKKTLKLLSIPRDTMSNEDRAIQKINASYSVDHPGNIEQTIREVEQVTALPIDRYAITTFEGFEKAIDAIGGVEMYVPSDLQYSDPYQDLEINLKQGNQVLDGQHALQFVRYRAGYATGDLGRINAQQLFFEALANELLDTSIITKVPALAKIVSEEMETDLTVSEMVWFFKQAQGMSADNIDMFVLPGSAEYVNDLSYYIPSESGIIDLINSEFMEDGKQIDATDLDLVPMASSVQDTTNTEEALQNAGIVDNGYDNNGSYVGSGEGGTIYEGNGGAYVPPPEYNTGDDYRDSTTETVPSPPTADDDSGATIIPGGGSSGGSSSGGSGNTDYVE
ncbi:MAG: LCP family protein [Peptococcaceae bacterium]|nr:LCP family protein [Peptococcaceae bacterium]